MNSKFRYAFAATGLAGSLAVGGLAVANAQTTTPTPTTVAPATSFKAEHSTRAKAALAPLVAAGTITQAQADAVIKALEAAAPAGGPGGGHDGMGHMGGRGGGRGPGGHNRAELATALGISEADLHTAFQAGKSIAQVASEKGVSIQKVIDVLVAAEQLEHPNEALADITARVTKFVNATRSAPPTKPAAAAATAA